MNLATAWINNKIPHSLACGIYAETSCRGCVVALFAEELMGACDELWASGQALPRDLVNLKSEYSARCASHNESYAKSKNPKTTQRKGA